MSERLSQEEILKNVEGILEQFRERELSGNREEGEEGEVGRGEGPTPFLFACLSGSILYNLHLKSSDRDYLAVYVASLERLLAVSGTPRGAYSNPEGAEEDYALYEVAHFVRYLKKGNPKLVQPLWCRRDHVFGSKQWDRLLGIRQACLSLNAAQQFTSMAVTQYRDAMSDFKKIGELKKDEEKPQLGVPKPQECWANNNRNPHKKMYHATRLIKEVLRILGGQAPLVYLEGEERDKILAIRKGERDLNELFKEFEHDLEKVNAEMALLKEKNKKKGENVEVDPNEFSLQQDMSLLPGSPIFEWLESVRADQIQEWCQRNRNHPSFARISALKSSIEKDSVSLSSPASASILSSSPVSSSPHDPPLMDPGFLWLHTQKAMEENKELPEGSTLLALIPSGFLSISHNFSSTTPSPFVPDYVGIFAFPAEAHLLLQAPDSFEVPVPPPFGEGSEGKKEKPAYYRGIRVYEIRRAMSLMLAGNHRLSEALFYSLKQGVETKNPQQMMSNSSSSSSPSPYPPIIAVSVWKEIATVLKPRLFNAAVARHYEGLVKRNLKLMDKDMLAILGKEGGESPEVKEKEEEKVEEKGKKGKGKGEEVEKTSKETRRMKNKKSKEINMTKEEVSKLLGGLFYHSLRLLIALSGFSDENNPSPKVDFDKTEIEELTKLRKIKDGVALLPHCDVRTLILKVEEKTRVVMEEVEKRGLLLNKFPIDKLEQKKMTLDLDRWMFEIAMCLSKNVQ